MAQRMLKAVLCCPLQEDDYSYIMAEALADRLAEAFAEVLHKITRRELWGYAADEALSSDDLLKVKYQGELVLMHLLPAAARCSHV